MLHIGRKKFNKSNIRILFYIQLVIIISSSNTLNYKRVDSMASINHFLFWVSEHSDTSFNFGTLFLYVNRFWGCPTNWKCFRKDVQRQIQPPQWPGIHFFLLQYFNRSKMTQTIPLDQTAWKLPRFNVESNILNFFQMIHLIGRMQSSTWLSDVFQRT